MLEVFLASNFDERLVRARTCAKHGTLGKSSPFGALLTDLGFVPAAYSMLGWQEYLLGFSSQTTGTDFERFGKPVIAYALYAFLRGDNEPIDRVKTDTTLAIQNVRNARRDARMQRASRYSPTSSIARTEADLTSTYALTDRIDDALSLLEGASRANNLTRKQRIRAMGIAERAVQTGETLSQPNRPMVAIVGESNTQATTAPNGGTCGVTDGSSGWGNAFRDAGQFGSHAAFDDMGDESMP